MKQGDYAVPGNNVADTTLERLSSHGATDVSRTHDNWLAFSYRGKKYELAPMINRQQQVTGFMLKTPFCRQRDRFPLCSDGAPDIARMVELIDTRTKVDAKYQAERLASDAVKATNESVVERVRGVAAAYGLVSNSNASVEPSSDAAGKVWLRLGGLQVTPEQAERLIALYAELRATN